MQYSTRTDVWITAMKLKIKSNFRCLFCALHMSAAELELVEICNTRSFGNSLMKVVSKLLQRNDL